MVLDLWSAAGQTATADSCAWDVLNDQAISTALFSVREEPLLINFSDFGRVSAKYNAILYHFVWMFEIAVLGDQGSKMRKFVMNF